MSLKTPHVLLVDGMSLLKTVPYGVQALDNAYAFTFMNSLISYLTKNEVASIIVAWEGGDGGRSGIYGPYKSDRGPSKEAVRRDRESLQAGLVHFGVTQAVLEGYEADDALALMCETLTGLKKVIFSGDTDMLQLVSPEVTVYQNPSSGTKKLVSGSEKMAKGRVHIDCDNFIDHVGFHTPAHYLKWKLTRGDSTDRTPGVYGVGAAVVRDHILGRVVSAKAVQKIEEFQASELYQKNIQLIQLYPAVDRIPDYRDRLKLTLPQFSKQKAKDFLTEMQFARLLDRFEAFWPSFEKAAPFADVPTLS